jgi:hypothetical protein
MFHGASSLACRQTIVPPWGSLHSLMNSKSHVPAEQTERRCDPQWQKEYSEDNNEHAKLLDLVTLFAHVVGQDPCQRQSIHRLPRTEQSFHTKNSVGFPVAGMKQTIASVERRARQSRGAQETSRPGVTIDPRGRGPEARAAMIAQSLPDRFKAD